MKKKNFKRRSLAAIFVLTLVLASLAIALPSFAESHGVDSPGAENNDGGVVNAVNTIISGNFAPNSSDLYDSFSGSSTNNLVGGDARLLPLGNYGGARQTHALSPDSPAINADSDCVLTQSCTTFNASVALTTDQRGAKRLCGHRRV